MGFGATYTRGFTVPLNRRIVHRGKQNNSDPFTTDNALHGGIACKKQIPQSQEQAMNNISELTYPVNFTVILESKRSFIAFNERSGCLL